ncbi:hypothetical protein [Parvularcula maris]|uniref:VanZ family protein n=1 Tax=Parvularcula maris TaxID=2965077 RepID=A0A9X2L852_9PROT|nr:hypothetical protein [Parvularcula maris]MCQ8183907.1 hypothetical protein [Parvularcula maris]
MWVGLGAVGYEALQVLIPERTVDPLDVVASLAALPLAALLWQLFIGRNAPR